MKALYFALLLCVTSSAMAESFAQKLTAAAIERTKHWVIYNGAYRVIDYPNADVPKNLGVCTDVIVRSYRSLGIDLQQRVHEDMQQHFALYPSKRIWGLNKPDTNIDHRRVPNLQVFLQRHGQSLVVSQDAQDYHPGDIVTWMLPGNKPHIGIISDQQDERSGTPKVVHNIGWGPKLDAMLFDYKITGHYRYQP